MHYWGINNTKSNASNFNAFHNTTSNKSNNFIKNKQRELYIHPFF